MRRIILIFMILAVSIYANTNNSTDDIIYWKNQYVMKDRLIFETNITDGDTFKHTFKGWEHKIRLYAIDTPEIGKAKTDLEKKYGIEASNFLASILTNKKVNIKVVGLASGCRETGIVTIGQGKNKLNVNKEMLRAGWAIVAERYCKEWDYDEYIDLQEEAKKNKVGFWVDDNFQDEVKVMINRYKSDKEIKSTKAVKK